VLGRDRQEIGCDRRDDANAQRAGERSAEAAGEVDETIGVGKQRARVVDDRASGGADQHPLRVAL